LQSSVRCRKWSRPGAAKEERKALAQLLAKPGFHWRCMGLPALRIVIWLRNAAFETLR
jgi:hypothetical protein